VLEGSSIGYNHGVSTFWKSVEQAAAEVKIWPQWKRAGVVAESVRSIQRRTTMIAVRQALLESDDLRRAPWRGSANPYAGHCYVASETLYHLLGGPSSDLRPATVKIHDVVHWFLEGPGVILDPTADQFNHKVPYEEARRRGFLTKKPSRRAQELIRRVRAAV
jgi:hypothetical protein